MKREGEEWKGKTVGGWQLFKHGQQTKEANGEVLMDRHSRGLCAHSTHPPSLLLPSPVPPNQFMPAIFSARGWAISRQTWHPHQPDALCSGERCRHSHVNHRISRLIAADCWCVTACMHCRGCSPRILHYPYLSSSLPSPSPVESIRRSREW